MDLLKKPEGLVGIASLAASAGTSYYVYKQLTTVREDLTKLKQALGEAVEVLEEQSPVYASAKSIHALVNKHSMLLNSHTDAMEQLAQDVGYLKESVDSIRVQLGEEVAPTRPTPTPLREPVTVRSKPPAVRAPVRRAPIPRIEEVPDVDGDELDDLLSAI